MQYTETIAPTITTAITTGIITPIGAEDLPPVFLPLEKKLKTAKFRVSFKIYLKLYVCSPLFNN